MNRRAVFPGSFDPFTIGHYSLVEKGLSLFEKIVIGVGVNSEKACMFPIEKRHKFIEDTFNDRPEIEVIAYQGLTIDFCRQVGASFIIRGLRNAADFEFERSIAQVNKQLSGIETIFLISEPSMLHLSSGIVRDVIRNGGDYSALIPNKGGTLTI